MHFKHPSCKKIILVVCHLLPEDIMIIRNKVFRNSGIKLFIKGKSIYTVSEKNCLHRLYAIPKRETAAIQKANILQMFRSGEVTRVAVLS